MDSRHTKEGRTVEMTDEELDAIYNSPEGKMYVDDERREMNKIVFRTHRDDSIEILKLKFADRNPRNGQPFTFHLELLVGLRDKGSTEEQLVFDSIESGKNFNGKRLIQFPGLGLEPN